MKVLYFASLKETLKTSYDDLAFNNISIKDLKLELSKIKKNKVFLGKNIMCAVNQEMANDETIIKTNDEVAFFPPVTGG